MASLATDSGGRSTAEVARLTFRTTRGRFTADSARLTFRTTRGQRSAGSSLEVLEELGSAARAVNPDEEGCISVLNHAVLKGR